ncbi:MAG: hypothetical protein BroJett030_23240 [Alphaproteobacteria bacterium]|nr:MAG: hypothetical protein BroJett030_23240 [Alphaproteobacteria bacterium]
MAKAYWIAHVDVRDPETYKRYVEGARPAFERFGARFLARGGPFLALEGQDLGKRHVVIEFDSVEAARACYDSPEYQAARQHRLPVATAVMLIVEGVG